MSSYKNPTGGYWAPGASEYRAAQSGASAPRMEAPGAEKGYDRLEAPAVQETRNSYPPVSDYKVEPETNKEYFRGEVRECLPANPTHSEQHSTVVGVLRAYAKPGYTVDIDLLTRQDEHNNFASDVCLRQRGIDPATEDRYLEEVAVEIKATQRAGDLKERARLMAQRGVRRVFAISVKGDKAGDNLVAGPLLEWQPERDDWKTWSEDELLDDPCLTGALRVGALLDAVQAEKAIVNAVIESGHPDMVKYGDEREQRGIDVGTRKALLRLMQARGLRLDASAKTRIEACTNEDIMNRWIDRAATANEIADIFDDA
ncbi:Uma2 family endonuclease [Haliangium sp.]|uniref:Uma2 family endonuclease n=1 Tax=Haliangium sp. TaxID=2663208 RepID=UPI003D132A45